MNRKSPRQTLMSRQLAVASAFSVFALSAFALFGPSHEPFSGGSETGAATTVATPAFSADLSLID